MVINYTGGKKLDFFDTNEIYKNQYEKTYRFLKSGLTGNIKKDISNLESSIKTLIDCQGIDWIGRGDLFLVKNQAQIAANETLLYELKKLYDLEDDI